MITRQFEARIRRVEQTDVDIPVQVVLSYDAGTDPYAVEATFVGQGNLYEEDRVWTFGRELLAVGAFSPVPLGRGDVRFRCYPDAHDPVMLMCMRAPGGHADITFPHGEVIEFLKDTQLLFKEAIEDCTPAVDQFLKEVLG